MTLRRPYANSARFAIVTHSCTISASSEVIPKRRGAILQRHHTARGANSMRRYHHALMTSTISHPMKTTDRSTTVGRWHSPHTAILLMLMLGKDQLSGLWGCRECRSHCWLSHTRSVSLSCFTAVVCLTTFVATRLCRCLLQSVRVNVMPWRLLFVISGILAGGIPGFRIELLLLPTPSEEAQCVLWRVCLFCVCMGLRQHGTKDVSLHVTRWY